MRPGCRGLQLWNKHRAEKEWVAAQLHDTNVTHIVAADNPQIALLE